MREVVSVSRPLGAVDLLPEYGIIVEYDQLLVITAYEIV